MSEDPRSGMSTAKRKRARRNSKAAQGFEKNPPRCINCTQYDAPRHGAPSKPGAKAVAFHPPFCKLGKFAVKPSSICDRWVGDSGETLE